ncbi:MAG: hypothetical protein ACMUEL_09475 [Flavobacteriales bacterium Tduv]
MILAVHRVATSEHDTKGLNSLISKLGYNHREVYCSPRLPSASQQSYFHSREINAPIQKKLIETALK